MLLYTSLVITVMPCSRAYASILLFTLGRTNDGILLSSWSALELHCIVLLALDAGSVGVTVVTFGCIVAAFGVTDAVVA